MAPNKGYIRQAWLVLALAACFGGALAGVQASLSGRIAENRLSDTMSQVPALVSGAVRGEPDKSFGELTVYRALDASGRQVGWVLSARGQGFADVVQLLIGLDAEARTVTGLYVLDQKETPGLGARIAETAWRGQFVGQSTAKPLEVVKSAPAAKGRIQAVTGATISSESVTGIVNAAVAHFRQVLAAAGEKQANG